MTSNFTAAELRDLADKLRLPLRNQDHVKTEDDASEPCANTPTSRKRRRRGLRMMLWRRHA